MSSIFSNNSWNEKITKDGYLTTPFLTQGQVEELTQFYLQNPLPSTTGTQVTMFHPSSEYRSKVEQTIRRICEAKARELFGNYQVLYTNFMVKHPGQEGDFPLHQDWTYVDETKHQSFAVWIPLVNVDENNGVLRVVKGSHHFHPALRGPHVHEPFQKIQDSIKANYSEAVSLNAGEALIWDHRLLHFSLPNSSIAPRLVVTLIMIPKEAKAIHCYGLSDTKGSVVETYEVDAEFFMRNTIGNQPEQVPLIAKIEQPLLDFTELQFKEMYAQNANSYHAQSKQVAAYYNEWQPRYDAVYGKVIQAFRPTDEEALMQHIARAAKIENGQTILDAGCGIGGPAQWLAAHFDVHISGVTISDVQAKQANEYLQQNNLLNKVKIKRGDYHELSKDFVKNTFDSVLFLESLGHAGEPAKAIAEAYEVLKFGGSIYIKDFYYKEPTDEQQQRRIQKTIANINRLYSYNTLSLTNTLIALRSVGFEIEFIRQFSFADDIAVRLEFESRFGIDIFDGEPEFAPAEWLEIKCFKPRV